MPVPVASPTATNLTSRTPSGNVTICIPDAFTAFAGEIT